MKTLIIIFTLFIALSLPAQDEVTNSTRPNQVSAQTTLSESIINSKQYQRRKWYTDRRKNADGSQANILENNWEALLNYKREHPEVSRSPHGSWSFLGMHSTLEGSRQGRVNSIDIHPTNQDIIYICTPNGGIWRSLNGGFSWTPISDHLGLLSFSDLEISPTNPNVIYALSGDGDPAVPASGFHGQAEVISAGIFISSDAGVTWSKVNYNFPETIIPNKLLMHPSNSNIQYMACNTGLYKTTDGWSSNSNTTKISSALIYDIEFHPANPNILYLGGSNKVYKFNNSTNVFNQVQNIGFSRIDTASRIEIAVTPDYPNYVALSAGNWDSGSIAFFSSSNSGNDNTWILRNADDNIIGNFATYCTGFAIDPNDYKKYYAGGVGFHRSNNEGLTGSWSPIGSGVIHADVHDVVISGNRIYVASDGGVFRSTDGGNTWIDLSDGLQITEIYRMSGSLSNSELFYIGTQDNGTLKRTGSGGNIFDHVLWGDGMVNIIDYNNNDIVYATTQNGGFHKSTNGGSTFSSISIDGSGAWISPLIMDQTNSNRLFFGKDSIYRSNNGGAAGTWEFIGSPSLPSSINNLAQGKSNPNRLYASQNNNFYRCDNALASANSVSWTAINTGLPNDFITDILVHPSDSRIVYVTLGNYDGGNKVYVSSDMGNPGSWTNISGSLPNVPVLTIALHNDQSGIYKTYIGTDIGVFYRDLNIGDWVYFSNFLPAVPVEDLYINSISNTIAAGTYGRGLWRSNLISSCPNNKVYTSGVFSTGRVHTSVNQIINSAATISGQPGTEIYYRAGDIINLLPGFVAEEKSLFEAEIGPCPY